VTRGGGALALAVAIALLTSALLASGAGADSFTPIRMTVNVTPVARANVPLKTAVTVSADAGALDIAQGSVRVGVKLAIECGGSFETTPGVTLLDGTLTPQPRSGRAYTGSASGSGRPSLFGSQTLCVFLEDSVDRVFANDESGLVDVSRACTTDASRDDAAEQALNVSQRQLRHTKRGATARRAQLKRTIAKRRRAATSDQRAARQACGNGVPL
jgi:hypothetical protein